MKQLKYVLEEVVLDAYSAFILISNQQEMQWLASHKISIAQEPSLICIITSI